MPKIFVICHQNGNCLDVVKYACTLNRNKDISVISIENADKQINEIKSLPINKIIKLIPKNDVDMMQINNEYYTNRLEKLLGDLKPDLIISQSTDFDVEILPRVAYRLKGTCILNALGLVISSNNELIVDKYVYGGKAIAQLNLSQRPFFIGVQKGQKVDMQFEKSDRPPDIIEEIDNLPFIPMGYKTITRELQLMDSAIENSSVVVAGGRGIGSKEGFTELTKIAKLLNGAVGASLGAVQKGWISEYYQVGQTGKVISPEMYIAIGISGAIQHIAGIRGAKHMCAINSDREAPIFDVAEVGIVEEYEKLIPILYEKINNLKRQ